MVYDKIKNLFTSNHRRHSQEIYPDEIFLDSSNLPQFDKHQFEGVIETPISKRAVLFAGIVFILIGFVFLVRIADLQIIRGSAFDLRSENNRFQYIPIFSNRGVIYDRNGEKLAWNSLEIGQEIPDRIYSDIPGLSHTLGYVKPPAKDTSGFYYQENFQGIDGIESMYNDRLNGKNGLQVIESDALMNETSRSVLTPPSSGENITLTIDSVIQNKLFEFIESLSKDKGFSGGAGVLMDVNNGEILALASFPEYSSSVLSGGVDADKIASYNSDKRKPFLNRVVSGLYTPGSIIKPIIAVGALEEGVISPDKKILSTGSISIQHPYYEDLFSVFIDWKAHGWVSMRDALAISSNVYFYSIGGGFEDQRGIGIDNIEKYSRMFGLGKETGIILAGEKEGVIPTPKWKADNFDGDPWRVGDTYNTSIGQYGFQVTPLQMVRAISAFANNGILYSPKIVQGSKIKSDKIDVSIENMNIVKEGMRQAVTSGTAKGLNVSYVEVSAKTGTAEVGISKKQVNSWIVGYFPYENPKYSFSIVMEKGPRENTIGGLFVMRQLLDWMAVNTPEYLN